jgi:hypothetical protein
MNAVGAIRQILLDNSNVTDMLASATAIFPVVIPQAGMYPAITVAIGDDEPEDYKWTPTAELERLNIAIAVFAKDYSTAQAIDTAVRNAIDGYVGGVTTSDSVVHYIHDVAFRGRSDGFDSDNILFYRDITYRVIYHRDVPPLPFGPPYISQAQAWFDGLPEYDSDESAIADGMEVGQIYKTSASHVSVSGGIAKQIQL